MHTVRTIDFPRRVPDGRLDLRRIATVVHVAGEVDAATVPEFRSALRWCDDDPAVQALDLTGVTFFAGAGVRCLVEAGWTLRPHDVVIASPAVRRTFEVCDLGFLLDAHGWSDARDGDPHGALARIAN